MEFYTTRELIEEISKRTTFAGIIIQQEFKNTPNVDGKWDIDYCNLAPDDIQKLLERTTKHFSGLE